jgi:hypothetical protein
MRGEVNQPQHWIKYVEKLCDVNFHLADEVIWGWRNLIREWQHMKLRNHFHPTVPCCTENGWARPFFLESLRPFFSILLVVAQTISSPSSDSN